jgi:hypothetical protein
MAWSMMARARAAGRSPAPYRSTHERRVRGLTPNWAAYSAWLKGVLDHPRAMRARASES